MALANTQPMIKSTTPLSLCESFRLWLPNPDPMTSLLTFTLKPVEKALNNTVPTNIQFYFTQFKIAKPPKLDWITLNFNQNIE